MIHHTCSQAGQLLYSSRPQVHSTAFRPLSSCPAARARRGSSSSGSSSSSTVASCSTQTTSLAGHQHLTRRRGSRLNATQGGLGDEEVDVAVFRFTLGIPGFDDSNIPRVVGAAVAALVAINHAIGGADPAPAQVRAEFLDITLAVLCFVAPEIEQRLRQVGPGRGRAGVGQVQGASQVFALADSLADAVKKELAWASFALLKNVNCCSVLLLQPGKAQQQASALLARGAVASSCVTAGDSKASLQSISQSLASSSVLKSSQQQQQQQWLPDRSALQQAGLGGCACVPEGVQSALVQPVAGGAVLLVLAERPRALSEKDRKWVAAIAAKLGDALQ